MESIQPHPHELETHRGRIEGKEKTFRPNLNFCCNGPDPNRERDPLQMKFITRKSRRRGYGSAVLAGVVAPAPY